MVISNVNELPKKWCFKGYTNNFHLPLDNTNETYKYFKEKFNCKYGFYIDYHYYSDGDSTSKHQLIKPGFTEISHDDFIKYVINKEVIIKEDNSQLIKLLNEINNG